MKKANNILINISFVVLTLLLVQGCDSDQSATTQVSKELTAEEAKDIAKEAYNWGMHKAAYYHWRYTIAQNEDSKGFAGMGRFSWNRQVLTADNREVSAPNASTMYGWAFFDLSKEPVVVLVPEIKDRYWSVQSSDHYPNWHVFIGSQFTGSKPQKLLIVGPNFKAEDLPVGFKGTEIKKVPSDFILLGARYGKKNNSAEEIAEINGLMDATTAVYLSQWEQNGRAPLGAQDQPIVKADYPMISSMKDVPNLGLLPAAEFAELYKVINLVINDPSMTKHTDSYKEIMALKRFEKIGLVKGGMFDINALKPEIQKAIGEGMNEQRGAILDVFKRLLKFNNGWGMGTDFEYDPGDWEAQGALGAANIAAPIPFASHFGGQAIFDSKGRPISADHSYTLTMDVNELPQVSEFWSIAMYDKAGFFVANELNRYSVSSFMYNNSEFYITEDGKLTFYIQPTKPKDENKAKNWLPSPKGGAMKPTTRYYGPTSALIAGKGGFPALVKVE